MHILIQFYLLFKIIAILNAENDCDKRHYDRDSFVCVCNGQHCDSPQPIGQFDENQLVYFVSDKAENRLKRFVVNESKGELPSAAINLEIRIDATQQFQRIFGFGGAFTDSAGITMNSLSQTGRQMLLRQYYDQKIGIGYSIGRVPIASCDFSTHEYSYLDTPNDFNLSTFQLAKEDLEVKIPNILEAMALAEGQLRLFSSPWAAPGWMKTTGRMKGGGQLKGEFNGKYYKTYAQYFKRFFEEYAKRNITFWGLTIENEPGAGLIPLYAWQAMYLSSQMQRDFASELLLPALKESEVSKNVKIMAHDDQRNGIFDAAKEIYGDPEKAAAIDGLASHWYSRSAYDVLQKAHNVRPDKFILATEACNGYLPWEHKPQLGEWSRGLAYGQDILNNLKNWVVGWTDWNLCLDLEGGPNWVKNFVDAPIIVNATAGEFYKQPMFYFLAHFSHFVPRDSVVISSSLFANGSELFDIDPYQNRPSFTANDEEFLDVSHSKNAVQTIQHVAFRTPDGNRVLVLINSNLVNNVQLEVSEEKPSKRSWAIPVGPSSIVTAIWKKNAK